MARAAAPRVNPDRTALMRDIVATLDPTETELWRERFEHARSVAVEDSQAELIEGLRDLAHQFQEAAGLARITPAQHTVLLDWLMTAPATFRTGGPLERGDHAAATAEAVRAYHQFAEAFGAGNAALKRQLAKWKGATAFWDRVLRWTQERLDLAVRETSLLLWDFAPFQEALTRLQRAAGVAQLYDEIRARILEPFPGATAAAEGLAT